MERPFDKIAEFTVAHPIIKPKPGSFSITDKPVGAFLGNILGFLKTGLNGRFSFGGIWGRGIFFSKGFGPYAMWVKAEIPNPFCKQSSIAIEAAHNTQSTEMFWFGDYGLVDSVGLFPGWRITPEKISVDLVKLMVDFCGEEYFSKCIGMLIS